MDQFLTGFLICGGLIGTVGGFVGGYILRGNIHSIAGTEAGKMVSTVTAALGTTAPGVQAPASPPTPPNLIR